MRYAAFLRSAAGEERHISSDDRLAISFKALEIMAEWRQGKKGEMTLAVEGTISCDGVITHHLKNEHWIRAALFRQDAAADTSNATGT